jgi:hypothetical protein
VKAEIIAAEQRYREFAYHLKGRVHYTMNWKASNGSDWQQIRYHEVKATKDCASWLVQCLGEKEFDGEVVGTNKDYAFRLKRKSKDSGWYQTDLAMKKSGELAEPAEIPRPIRRTTEQLLLAPYNADGRLLTEWIEKTESSHQMKATEVTIDGRPLVRVELDTSHALDSTPRDIFQGCTVLVDPARHWSIVESEVRCEWGTNKVVDKEVLLTYVSSKSGLPIPRQSHFVRRDGTDSSLHGEAVSDFHFQESASPTPDTEFRLPAYGLPDPVPYKPTVNSHWMLILAAVGFGLLVLGFLIRKLVQIRTDATSGGAVA